MDLSLLAEALIDVVKEAGSVIMSIYQADIEVVTKEDQSPLTLADKAANDIIIQHLKRLAPEIPVISEESKEIPYEVRKNWNLFWLVDPLDGTKEFINKNGEFTVNIALIEHQKPILGIIHAPALELLLFAVKDKGVFTVEENGHIKKTDKRAAISSQRIRVLGSRSHQTPALLSFVEDLKLKYPTVDFVSVGSSLKFCYLALDKADIYPRLGPTMEWDTAAGHIIAEEAGASLILASKNEPLYYNKESLLNPDFIATHLS